MRVANPRWIQLAAVASAGALLAALAPPFLKAYACHADWASGPPTQAEVLTTKPGIGVVLRLDGPSEVLCTAPSGPTALAAFTAGERVAVHTRAARPGRCELAATLDASRQVLLTIGSTTVALLLGIALVAIRVQRQWAETHRAVTPGP